MSKLTLSVVIPAHNEEHYIGKCLDALLTQEDDLHEILVVDNNSTDRTAEIVRSYLPRHPKLKLLAEPRPGVAFARNLGFDTATGEILGRLDADSRAYDSWAQTILEFFGRDDVESVGAISGLNNSYDSPFTKLKGWYTKKQIERGAFGGDREINNLHGANMAVRHSVWDKVRDNTSTENDVHEDLDLALTIREEDIKIRQLSDLMVDISPRRALTPPREFTKYIDSGTKTFDMHGKLTPEIEKALKLHWRFHALLYVLHRPYDPEAGKFSLKYFRAGSKSRRLPIDTA
ncbi:glycosyltransferase [Antrihabitans cavernicola]|uniref:Glycosyltransferase n=1 Tax=Antrihabitans cavernicola TaxID=2495913 RepID=A0A5A7SEE5_9NOCA|nr:glycosyltransferase [Spelaeibacter cavernicola]KAA0022895.1 glycosyltransferase [Spelaeibacter cavernicola]